MNRLLLTCWLVLLCGSIYAQNAPQAVQTVFQNTYPYATDIEWEDEGNGKWEVEFRRGGKEWEVEFAPNGEILEKEVEISRKDLPNAIFKRIKREYKGYKIDEIKYVEAANENGVYEVELEKEKKEIELVLDKDGNILTKEVEGEDED